MKLFASALLLAFALSGARAATAGESTDYLFRLHCSGCHGIDGTGSQAGRIPPFPGIVGHFVGSPEGRLYLVHVPGIANAALPDRETADLLNYVLHTWGGISPDAKQDFSPDEVGRLRAIHVDDVAELRRKLSVELAKQGVSTDY
jgi:mono/diheme cytochrome c family protein